MLSSVAPSFVLIQEMTGQYIILKIVKLCGVTVDDGNASQADSSEILDSCWLTAAIGGVFTLRVSCE
jgi:hypothetical protein